MDFGVVMLNLAFNQLTAQSGALLAAFLAVGSSFSFLVCIAFMGWDGMGWG